MSVVPRSLCAVDGSLYIPTDKSCLMHAIEGAQSQAIPCNIPPQLQLPKVLIIDAMAVLQTMKKSSTTKKLSDLEDREDDDRLQRRACCVRSICGTVSEKQNHAKNSNNVQIPS